MASDRQEPFEALDPALASALEDAAVSVAATVKRFTHSGDGKAIAAQRVVWFYATLARSAALGMLAMLRAECDHQPWALLRSLYEYFTRATYFVARPDEALRFVRSMPVARRKAMLLRGHRLEKRLRDELDAAAEAALAVDPTLAEEGWELEKMMAAISEAKHKDRQLFYFVAYRFGSGVIHGDAWLLDKVYRLDVSGRRVVSLEPFRPLSTNRLAYHAANILTNLVALIGEAHGHDVSDATAPLIERLRPFEDTRSTDDQEPTQ